MFVLAIGGSTMLAELYTVRGTNTHTHTHTFARACEQNGSKKHTHGLHCMHMQLDKELRKQKTTAIILPSS